MTEAALLRGRLRPRLSRTFSSARWREYGKLLEGALDAGYRLVSLEKWVLDGPSAGPTLVMRHDVDQTPRSALTMAEIERDHGVSSTWYFRWRTADRRVVEKLRAGGFDIGFHYETLTREALARGLDPQDEAAPLVEACRKILRSEIIAFVERHGAIRSICPHGDTRIPHVQNGVLVRDIDPQELGVDFDGNEVMRGRGLAYWLTDRSRAEGGWNNGIDPARILEERLSPVLCVVHPNNWNSGFGLWAGRLEQWIRRTGDAPPL